MEPFGVLTGLAVPLDRANVDTDQIIPKQFLKRVERTGFGEFLFNDWRYASAGDLRPDFVLNQAQYQGATVLVAGRNFGSGSSREHAPWALLDYGFRAIVAPSFADIFYSNCFQNGILPVRVSEEVVTVLLQRASEPGYHLTVDLERCIVSDAEGLEVRFDVDPYRRRCLLEGLDDIALAMQHGVDIERYEAARQRWMPAVVS